MGYSGNIYRLAKEKIDGRRTAAERALENRRKRAYSALPEIEGLEREIASCGIIAARAVLKGGDITEEMEKLKEKNLFMQSEIVRLLTENGFPEDYLEPHYECKLCNDTGFVESNGKTLRCKCFKSVLVSCACEELNRSAPLALCTFDNFNLDYYSKEVDPSCNISPYTMMSKIFNFCLNYVDKFSENSRGILMQGATGLGKTHLSLAIANEILKKGYGVIYTSAPSLTSKLEKIFFSKADDSDGYFDTLVNCDLLIIDDLGTEFQSRFSSSQIYNLFNSRILLRKPVIINTNLTLHELEGMYSERFVSRICGETERLNFINNSDIRVKNPKKS